MQLSLVQCSAIQCNPVQCSAIRCCIAHPCLAVKIIGDDGAETAVETLLHCTLTALHCTAQHHTDNIKHCTVSTVPQYIYCILLHSIVPHCIVQYTTFPSTTYHTLQPCTTLHHTVPNSATVLHWSASALYHTLTQ